jgi:hypothetical protein
LPRVDWSPSGELLTVVDGTLRIGERVVDGPDVRDARWRADGFVWIDARGVYRIERDGEVETIGEPLRKIVFAAIAAVDKTLVVAHYDRPGTPGFGMMIDVIAGNTAWRFDPWKHGGASIGDITSRAISGDGRFVAIGYENPAVADFNYSRKQGRGFMVIDTRTDTVCDRTWWEASRELRAMHLALDGKGKRVAFAQPETQPAIGAMRIKRDENYVRNHAGGACAVAIDDKGVLAAYAYPKGERRVRVDYLAPGADGPSEIALRDTLWIEPDCGDIVALAFDRKSHHIACLDATGRVDVVPVP